MYVCLVCEKEIKVDDESIIGEIFVCSACGQEHELKNEGSSKKLGIAPEIEEDWGE